MFKRVESRFFYEKLEPVPAEVGILLDTHRSSSLCSVLLSSCSWVCTHQVPAPVGLEEGVELGHEVFVSLCQEGCLCEDVVEKVVAVRCSEVLVRPRGKGTKPLSLYNQRQGQQQP
jgi:hypothetical protein